MTSDSAFSGFYKKTIEERRKILKDVAGFSEKEMAHLSSGGLDIKMADSMVENVVGLFALPLSLGVNFIIDGKERLIPMVTEETSVVAAASYGAKLCRETGGFKTETLGSRMIGQVQVTGVEDVERAIRSLEDGKEGLMEKAAQFDPVLKKVGGGPASLKTRIVETDHGRDIIIHLSVDTKDAMGANAVNTMVEGVASDIEKMTGGKVHLRIITNLADERLSKAEAVWPMKMIGENAIDGIMKAYELAKADIYRCATHNKGIMNGITSLVLATGNDTRAVESACYSYSSSTGNMKPLTHFERTPEGDLRGIITVPTPVGIVGGITSVHPSVRLSLKMLDVQSAGELGRTMAALGLAQNFAALKALATEGIQKGHMSLHAKNIAISAGAENGEIEVVAEKMVQTDDIGMENARKILERLRK